ncbi:MAG: DUF3307 domain-containing protein [Sulfobacillus sp.]
MFFLVASRYPLLREVQEVLYERISCLYGAAQRVQELAGGDGGVWCGGGEEEMNTETAPLILMAVFSIKHFYCDFPYQSPYMYLNKGTYGHPGGLLHSGLHAIVTLFLLWSMMPFLYQKPYLSTHQFPYRLIVLCAIAEFLIHYHIDWAKVKINRRYGWQCQSSSEFWTLLGLDQLLHTLTYIGIVYVVVR